MIKHANSILEPVIIEGEWWLPETPDIRCYGNLNYVVNATSNLKLWGKLDEREDCGQDYPVIHGIARGGVEVTIFDAILTKTSKTESRVKTYHQELSYLQFWTGRHFSSKIEVTLEVFYFGINNLEAWHNQRIFFHDCQKDEIIIKYVKQPELLLFEDDWVKISLYYEWSLAQAINQVDAGLEHAARISISTKKGKMPYYITTSEKKKTIEYYLEHIRNFFGVAVGRSTFSYHHRAILETITKTTDELRIDIPVMADKIKKNLKYRLEADYYFARSIDSKQLKTLMSADMIFPFEYLQEDLKGLMIKWFAQERLISIAIDDYIGFRNKSFFSKATLPLLIYAIEGLHRLLHPELDEKHKKIAQRLIDECPNAIKEKISKRLMKWCPLPERLHKILKEYEDVFPFFYEFKVKIVDDLVELRNNTSHCKSDDTMMNFGLEWAYAHMLSLILAAMFMEISGMGKEKMAERFSDLQEVREILKHISNAE